MMEMQYQNYNKGDLFRETKTQPSYDSPSGIDGIHDDRSDCTGGPRQIRR